MNPSTTLPSPIPVRATILRVPRMKQPRFTVANISTHLPPLTVGTALSAYVFSPALMPWMFPVCVAATAAAIYAGNHRIGPKLPFAGLLVILVAWGVAIPLAPVIGFGMPVASGVLAVWWGLMLLLYWASPTQAAFAYIVPAWLLNAGITVYQGMTGLGRSAALTDSSNVSAGFLVLGVVYTLTTRFKWLALPLTAAIPFTGSRLASVALLIVLAGMLARHSAPGRLIMACVIVVVLVSLLFQSGVADNYRVDADVTSKVFSDITSRLTEGASTMPRPPLLGIIPAGYMGAIGTHNVLVRMIFEIGVIPASIFLWVTAWALWIRPRFDVTWWMLVAFMLLGALDYYSWMPYTISAFWWVLVAIRIKNRGHANALNNHP